MTTWTVAYRRMVPEYEPVFHRVPDVELDWQAAVELAGTYIEALGDRYEVWYTSTRQDELAGKVPIEDVLNILVELTHERVVRVPIADDGLPLEALR